MSTENLKDVVAMALEALETQSISGRIGFVTGHTAENADGTVTVAFKSKHVGKTSTFNVRNYSEAKFCLKEMRKLTR